MKFENIFIVCIVGLIFLLGFLSASLFSLGFLDVLENPFSLNDSLNNDNAPSDFVDEEDIKIYDDRIVIYIDDASLSRYAPSGSMKPIFDEGANGIRVVPLNEDDVQVGDLISFKNNGKLIIHRVVEKGVDFDGIYFIAKGDNNVVSDGKIRFEDIKYKTIGVIW
jgi:signal peptidase I